MWILTTWLCISQEVTVKCFKKYRMSNAMDETDAMLWNDSEEDGIVRSEFKKVLTVKMETVTLPGKGR